eukprot:86148_1
MSAFRSLKQQELLLNGYCRLHYAENIPIMLIKIMLSFYNVIFYWKIKGEKLTQFLSTSYAECICSHPFTIKGITFQYIIYPNGSKNREGKVCFGLRMVQMNDLIDYILLKEMLCFNSIGSTHIKEDTLRIVSRKWSKPMHTANRFINVSECKNFKEITFYGKLDILRIQPKDMINNRALFYHKFGIKINRNTSFEWKFDNNLLEKLKIDVNAKSSVRKRYCSPYFDGNNWIIKLGVNFLENQWAVALFLLHLPEKIKSLDIKRQITVIRDDKVVFNKSNVSCCNYDNINHRLITFVTAVEDYQKFVAAVSISVC